MLKKKHIFITSFVLIPSPGVCNQKSLRNSDKSWSRLVCKVSTFLIPNSIGNEERTKKTNSIFFLLFWFTLKRIWSRLSWISLKESRTWRRAGASSLLTSLTRRSSSSLSTFAVGAIELFLCHTVLPLSPNPKCFAKLKNKNFCYEKKVKIEWIVTNNVSDWWQMLLCKGLKSKSFAVLRAIKKESFNN